MSSIESDLQTDSFGGSCRSVVSIVDTRTKQVLESLCFPSAEVTTSVTSMVFSALPAVGEALVIGTKVNFLKGEGGS